MNDRQKDPTAQSIILDNSNTNHESLADVKGLIFLTEMPQLFHARDAIGDSEPWQVSADGSRNGSKSVIDDVFYMTPHLQEAEVHVHSAEKPTFHAMSPVRATARVVTEDIDPTFARSMQMRVTDGILMGSAVERQALNVVKHADEADYTRDGCSYAEEPYIQRFATDNIPEGIDVDEWNRAVTKLISASNARKMLGIGSKAFIEAALEYTIDPEITLVYLPVKLLPNKEVESKWIQINRQYLINALTAAEVVGFTKRIDVYGQDAAVDAKGNKLFKNARVFNDAVMLWDPTAVQTEGLVDPTSGEFIEGEVSLNDIARSVAALAVDNEKI